MDLTGKVDMLMDLKLQKIYGYEAICGYVRDPHIKGHGVRGKCAITNKRCYRALPMNMHECYAYINLGTEDGRDNGR